MLRDDSHVDGSSRVFAKDTQHETFVIKRYSRPLIPGKFGSCIVSPFDFWSRAYGLFLEAPCPLQLHRHSSCGVATSISQFALFVPWLALGELALYPLSPKKASLPAEFLRQKA